MKFSEVVGQTLAWLQREEREATKQSLCSGKDCFASLAMTLWLYRTPLTGEPPGY